LYTHPVADGTARIVEQLLEDLANFKRTTQQM